MSIVELWLDSGVRRYSFEGASVIGEGWFSDRLVSVGSIYRDSPLKPGIPRIGDVTIRIDDPALLNLKDTEAFKNRLVRLRFGDALEGPSALTSLYTGRISDLRFLNGIAVITAADASLGRLRIPRTHRLNRVQFPSLPSFVQPYLVPVIYGTHESDTGAVPCYRLNSDSPFQYLVAGHVCKEVTEVFNYEALMAPEDWSAETIEVNGQEYQIIEFDVDPRDPDRPREFEVTANVKGKTDDGTTEGDLIENPAAQIEDYLLNEAGIDISELSTAHFDKAKAAAEAEGYKGAVWIGEEGVTHMDVVTQYSESFLSPFFMTRDGQYAVALLTANEIFGLSGEFLKIRDSVHLLNDFAVDMNRDVASSVEYGYQRQWASRYWEAVGSQQNNQEVANLGQEYPSGIQMWHISDVTTADKVGAVWLLISAEQQQFTEFELPIGFHDLDLDDIFELTHDKGLGGIGYAGVLFRVVSLEIDLEPYEARVRVRAARNLPSIPHCDSHADAHGDVSHDDAGHGDVSHDDAHSDTVHVDTPHVDHQHSDAIHHDFGHSDSPHNDNHVDSPHLDSPHADSHTDTPHSDVLHSDGHVDTAHLDSHTDTPHSDVLHDDFSHGDATGPFGPYHCDASEIFEHCDHEDAGCLTSHTDFVVETELDHGDSVCEAHFDAPFTDVPHGDIPHSDVPHSDAPHADSHGDTPHSDAHSDVIHVDVSHADAGHGDSHTDGAHGDVSHLDMPHLDSHQDAAHQDAHSDSHDDVPHSDTDHQDIAHSDTVHSDSHCDTGLDHTDHSDSGHEDHSDVYHGDQAA